MHKKKHLFFVLVFYCLNCTAQQSGSGNLYQSYDTKVDANLTLYNGKLNYFSAPTPDQLTNNAYLFSRNEYTKSDIRYEGQPYFDVDLKYDVFNDVLLVRPKGNTSDNIELIREKISEFDTFGKHFVNLNTTDGKNKISGYFMESVKNNDFSFYVKYKKIMRETEHLNRKVNDFRIDDKYFILQNGILTEVISRSGIAKIFPAKEDAINTFYKTEKQLLKEDETAFMEKLFRQLDNTATH